MVSERHLWAAALCAYERKYDGVADSDLTWQQKLYQQAWDEAFAFLTGDGFLVDARFSAALRTGLAYVTYVDAKAKQVIIGFRGSVNAIDWFQNIFGDTGMSALQGITIESRQALIEHVLPRGKDLGVEEPFPAASQLAQLVMAEYPRATVTLCGHSRGGAQAMYVAMDLGLAAVTFNPAPLPKSIDFSAKADHQKQIANFYVSDDITHQLVEPAQKFLFTDVYTVYGKQQFSAFYNLPAAGNDPVEVIQLLLDNHSMKMFLFNQAGQVITTDRATPAQIAKIEDLIVLKKSARDLEQQFLKSSSRVKNYAISKLHLAEELKIKYLAQLHDKIKAEAEHFIDEQTEQLEKYRMNKQLFEHIFLQLGNLYTAITREL